MAKRRKGEEEPEDEEDYEFVPPDFDEDAFIHKEMVSFRTTVTLILVGIAAALVSWGVFAAMGGGDGAWYVGLLIWGLSVAGLIPLYRVLRFDISHYGKREWLGTGFLSFFTWLAFFMLVINPPFSDFAEPQVDAFVSPNVVPADQDVTLDLFINDNDGIRSFSFELVADNGTVVADEGDLESRGGGHFRFRAPLAGGTFKYTAGAEDVNGLASQREGTFVVRPDPLDVEVGDLTSATGTVFVTVPADLRVYAVYADFDGDVATQDDRVYLERDESLGGWKASRNFAGWQQGENNFTIIVEERNRFHSQTLVEGGVIKDGPHTATVENPGEYDDSVPGRSNPTDPPVRGVPGFEVPLLVAGLLVVAFLVRRRA